MRGSGLLVVLLAGCSSTALPTNRASHDMATNWIPLNHRPFAPVCPSDRPAFNCSLTGPFPGCHADGDCTSGVNGRCAGNGHDGCNCSYDTCTNDADCAANQLCACRNTWHYGALGPNVCLPSNCRVDSDCGPNGFCSPSLDPTCGSFIGVTGWYCHTASDTCTNDDDCAVLDGGYFKPFCGYRPEVGHWACSTAGCLG
jgi:hypothetical protein